MKQEDKELLLKDLCARLPYHVKADFYGEVEEQQCIDTIDAVYWVVRNRYKVEIGQYDLPIEKVKPYLFPLYSMTEEQSKIYHELVGGMFGTGVLINLDCLIDFFNKNHLDWRGLIPMGLAKDATGLNIY